MKTIQLPSDRKGKIIVKILFETLCTWSYNYVTLKEIKYFGNSEDTHEHNHEVGLVKQLKNKPNNFDTTITNTTMNKLGFKLVLEWWQYVDNNPIVKLDSLTYEEELDLNTEKTIMETIVFE